MNVWHDLLDFPPSLPPQCNIHVLKSKLAYTRQEVVQKLYENTVPSEKWML